MSKRRGPYFKYFRGDVSTEIPRQTEFNWSKLSQPKVPLYYF